MFEILETDSGSQARAGRLYTKHGIVETPAFMPVGTYGAVKTAAPSDLDETGVQILLANAYHLRVRPGIEIVQECGGLHRFMGWNKPILTDSGGYQVFSLSAKRRIMEHGVEFSSHFDGARLFLGPAEVMDSQRMLGSDIAMVLDDCPPYPCSHEYACQSVEHTIRWANICSHQPRAEGQHVFGIVQGSSYPDLRELCAAKLVELDLDGYAIGGVSVGEPERELLDAVEQSVKHLPPEKPRYLMGVGFMRQIMEAVAMGVDMFDCVVPTRYARNGSAFTLNGPYPVKASKYRRDDRPVEEGCSCYVCRNFSRAYIRHLLNIGEILAYRLLTFHNIYRYMEFMRELRRSLLSGRFAAFRQNFGECGRQDDLVSGHENES